MNHENSGVQAFFKAYETATSSQDLSLIEALYSETFMLGSPQGTSVVKRDGFLNVLAQRSGFLRSIGWSYTRIETIQETRLDERYTLVNLVWMMRFEKADAQPIFNPTAASYILSREGGELRIVFQIDHQDLAQRAQELGLLPRKAD